MLGGCSVIFTISTSSGDVNQFLIIVTISIQEMPSLKAHIGRYKDLAIGGVSTVLAEVNN